MHSCKQIHDIFSAAQECCLVHCFRKYISHHFVCSCEEDFHRVSQIKFSSEVEPTIEMHGSLRRSWIPDDVERMRSLGDEPYGREQLDIRFPQQEAEQVRSEHHRPGQCPRMRSRMNVCRP